MSPLSCRWFSSSSGDFLGFLTDAREWLVKRMLNSKKSVKLLLKFNSIPNETLISRHFFCGLEINEVCIVFFIICNYQNWMFLYF